MVLFAHLLVSSSMLLDGPAVGREKLDGNRIELPYPTVPNGNAIDRDTERVLRESNLALEKSRAMLRESEWLTERSRELTRRSEELYKRIERLQNEERKPKGE